MKGSSVACALLWLSCCAAKEEFVSFRGSLERKLTEDEAYSECFSEIRKESVWPLVNGPGNGPISLAFGPYNSYCDHRQKFHRGITIHAEQGDEVQAIMPGQVVAIYGEEGDKKVIIEHTFPDGDCTFHKNAFSSYFSVYGHLQTVTVSVSDFVCGGSDADASCQDTPTIIGTVGTHSCRTSNRALHVSLSHEIKFALNSYSYCTAHPTGEGCDDPKDWQVNPLIAQEEDNSPSQFTVPTLIGAENDANYGDPVEVTITRPAESYTLNYIEVTCMEDSKDTTPDFSRIDFNKRTGFVTQYATAMDPSLPYIDATHTKVDINENQYICLIVIPPEFYQPNNECVLTAVDIFGNEDSVDVVLRDDADEEAS